MSAIVLRAVSLVVGGLMFAIGLIPLDRDERMLTIVYTPDIADLLVPLLAEYNALDRTIGGEVIRVSGQELASGQGLDAIASGASSPDVWIPAASVWGNLLAYEQGAPSVESAGSLVTSPQVIAMWEDRARSLGWPEKHLGWSDLIALTDPQSPRYDETFELGHTNPEVSTSGIYALTSEYLSAAGAASLPPEVARSTTVRQKVHQLEQSIEHYGDTSSTFRNGIRCLGQAYVTAVYIQETTLVELNNPDSEENPDCTEDWGDSLVGIYPAEGTFVADYPLFVDPGQQHDAHGVQAADDLVAWLRQSVDGETAAQHGFRTAEGVANPPVDALHGADPTQPGDNVLTLPATDVLVQLQEQWLSDRKPARIALVVDTSESMLSGSRLAGVKQAVAALIRDLQPQDEVGLISFSQDVTVEVPIRPGSHRQLLASVDSLEASEGTALYDAILRGFRLVERSDDDRIRGVVVVTDGDDDSSDVALADLLDELTQPLTEADLIRVVTVDFSGPSAAADDALQRISETTYGAYYSGGLEDIETAYHSIAAFF